MSSGISSRASKNSSSSSTSSRILSEASKKSLKVQGGIFSKEEAEEFINKPQMKEAVEMRRFDDQAKILNKETPTVEHFRQYVENSFQANSN